VIEVRHERAECLLGCRSVEELRRPVRVRKPFPSGLADGGTVEDTIAFLARRWNGKLVKGGR
jgi:hypothetical protein